LLALAAVSAHAQAVRPWTPPGADTLRTMAAEARTLFQAQTVDTVRQGNYRPYEIVGDMARRLVRSLGRSGLAQANAIEPVLDSLGLETLVRVDPRLPYFVLVAVRNPYRPSAQAAGILFWYRGQELRQQTVILGDGRDPEFRVWWTGWSERLYSLGLIDRAPDGALSWMVLGLIAEGRAWDFVQFVERAGETGRGQATFTDVNGDGGPELVIWARTEPDSTFQLCTDCPGLLTETVLVERAEGFTPFDTRLMPSPFASLTLFARLLASGNRAAAARLLDDPARLDEAAALGFGQRQGRGAWRVEYAEPKERWPRWLALRTMDETRRLHIVHFTLKDGRWVIRDWVPVRAPATPPPGGGSGR
jgi:hypothetical protein